MSVLAQRSPLEIPELLHLISNHLSVDLSSGQAGSCSLLPLLTVNHLFHDIFQPKLYTTIKLSGCVSWQRFLENGQSGWSSALEMDLRITDHILESGLWTRFLNEFTKGSFSRLRVLSILFNCSSTARKTLEVVPSDVIKEGSEPEGICLRLTKLQLDGIVPESFKRILLDPEEHNYQDLSISISQLQINTSDSATSATLSTSSSRSSENEQRLTASVETHSHKPIDWRELPSSVKRLSILCSTPFPCPNPFIYPSWQGDNATAQLRLIVNFLTNLRKQRVLGQQLELEAINLSAFAGPSRTWSGTFDTVIQVAQSIEGLDVLV